MRIEIFQHAPSGIVKEFIDVDIIHVVAVNDLHDVLQNLEAGVNLTGSSRNVRPVCCCGNGKQNEDCGKANT